MKNGRYVITAKGCPHCDTFKDVHKDKMNKIKEIVLDDVPEDHKVWGIIDEMDILGTPTVLDVKGKKICEIDVNDLETEIRCLGDGQPSQMQANQGIPDNSISFILNEVGGSLY